MTEIQTGRTTRMLEEAVEMLPNASLMPILIYGADLNHVKILIRMFCDIVQKQQMRVSVNHRNKTVFVNEDEMVEFRSFGELDSPPGENYSHIFVDHYAEKALGIALAKDIPPYGRDGERQRPDDISLTLEGIDLTWEANNSKDSIDLSWPEQEELTRERECTYCGKRLKLTATRDDEMKRIMAEDPTARFYCEEHVGKHKQEISYENEGRDRKNSGGDRGR